MARVRVFIATSLDGFIAGPNDELDWLNAEGSEDTFTPFIASVGALLMGRRTYDVVRGFDVPWPYGDRPVLIATQRPLESDIATVRAVGGSIAQMIAEAREVAGDKDVYIDGGALIRSALEADLIDDLTITVIPTAIGAGRSLFASLSRPHRFELTSTRALGGGLVELRYTPKPSDDEVR